MVNEVCESAIDARCVKVITELDHMLEQPIVKTRGKHLRVDSIVASFRKQIEDAIDASINLFKMSLDRRLRLKKDGYYINILKD